MAAPDFELADPEQRSKEIAQLGPWAEPFALRGVPELRSKAKRAGLVGNGTVSESWRSPTTAPIGWMLGNQAKNTYLLYLQSLRHS